RGQSLINITFHSDPWPKSIFDRRFPKKNLESLLMWQSRFGGIPELCDCDKYLTRKVDEPTRELNNFTPVELLAQIARPNADGGAAADSDGLCPT
ncbi:MAG: hypothetical protein AAGG44_09370, partial [Planctomycetota bacterium]